MMPFIAALLLLASAVAGWFIAAAARPPARVQLRFAAVLLAAIAAAAIATPIAASAVVLLVLPIAATVLALAALAGFERPLATPLSSLTLALASVCGIGGAGTGLALLTLAPSMLGTFVLLVVSLRRVKIARLPALQGALAALCLLAAQSLFVTERVSLAFLLFLSAGMLGVMLALSRSDLAAEQKAAADLRGTAIGGRRLG